MASCFPRVGITLADVRQACFRRRHIENPPQAIPANPITHVDGSGTGTGLARRKPYQTNSLDGLIELLMGDDKVDAASNQLPARSPRDEPDDASPSRSFHSLTLPLMSKAP